jgi:chromosome segregation ATPase
VNVEKMPFDQYQRYRLVSDLLNQLRGKRAKLKVLDVGGRTALLRGFLPKDEITLVDVEPSGEAGLVLGDGAKLPFRDKVFDVVAAFDTLEHVPPKLRKAFVRECARVSSGYVLLAGPYHSERVAEAEMILQRFLKDKLKYEHRYLEEHRHNGLPSRASTEKELQDLGAKVISIGHANLERWLAMMCLSMYLDHDPALRGLAARVHEFYNRALYASDHAEPVYRHVVIAAMAQQALPKAELVLDPPRAPTGALEPFTELSGELVAFDRERDNWRSERERLDQVNRDLAGDLAGHAATLEEIEAELALEQAETSALKQSLSQQHAEAAESIEQLETDLEAHRLTLQERDKQLEILLAAQTELEALLADDRAQATQAIEDLQGDLAGHQQRIRELEGEFAAQSSAFEQERAEVREVLDELQRDLDGHRESLAHVNRELAAREAHVVELIALADRERSVAEQSVAQLQAEIAAQRAAFEALAAQAQALREESERILHLMGDERAQAAASIESLRTEIAGLEAHSAALAAELSREQRAGAEVADALEADLREHRQTLAALSSARAEEQQQAGRVQARLEHELGEHAKVQSALGADLEGHRAALAQVRAELERTRGEAHAIQTELLAANAAAQGLGQTLSAREQEIAELRALLRSRVKNLKRALSFRKPAF